MATQSFTLTKSSTHLFQGGYCAFVVQPTSTHHSNATPVSMLCSWRCYIDLLYQLSILEHPYSNRLKCYRLSIYTTKTYCTYRGTAHSMILCFPSRKMKVSKWPVIDDFSRLISLLYLSGVAGCYHQYRSFDKS